MTSLIANQDRSSTEDPTASKIRKLYDDGTKDIKSDQLRYQENACFLEGDQWIYRHNQNQQIYQVPRDRRKVRATVARLGPESRRLFSKLLKRPLAFEVTPDAADDATIRGAKLGESVIMSVSQQQKWNRKREEAAWAAWKGGTSGLCMDWDTSAGRYVGAGPTTGKAQYEGDVCVTALAITEMCTEPGTRDIETACWWIKAQALPPREVKTKFGLSKEPPADAAAATMPAQRTLTRNRDGQIPPNLTLVLTYYERPNGDNKNGMVCTVVDNKVVDGPHDWPFPFKDRLNVVCVRETMVEGRWTGRTVITDAVPVQTALNHAWTSILEHLKQAGNARIQGNSAERSNADTWTDEAGEFIFYDTDKWEWMSPPPMPDWWQRTPQELSNSMDDIIGVHDVSRGAAPQNIQSGLGLSILAEQDDTPTGRFAQTLADAFGDLATMVLQTYEANVTQKRTTTLYQLDTHFGEKIEWDGQSFQGQTTVIVPYDAVAPINEAARFARGMSLLDRQIITNPRQLSAYIDVPGTQNFIEAIDPNVTKARRENYELVLGETVVPADFDDHQVHITEHNSFRLSQRYEQLDKGTRDKVDLHVQAHSTFAAEQAGQQQAKAQYAPGLAEAAQATQPPGSGNGAGPQAPTAMPQSGVLGGRMGGAPNAGPPTGGSVGNPRAEPQITPGDLLGIPFSQQSHP